MTMPSMFETHAAGKSRSAAAHRRDARLARLQKRGAALAVSGIVEEEA